MADRPGNRDMIRLLHVVLLSGLWTASLVAQTGTLLEQADTAFRNGDLEGAAVLARRVLEREPGAVHAHLILGVTAARKSDWAVSNRHFIEVVRLDPANPFGYFYLGQAKLYQKQWEPAVRYFAKALEHEYPDRDRVLVELAMAQNEAGRPSQAMSTLGKIAPPPDPQLAAQYHAISAIALSRLDQPAQAIEAIHRAIQLDETNPQDWALLIGTLIRTDQAPRALAEAIVAQKKFPDQPDIQFLFALASYYVSESPLSGLALRNLREADPADARVLLAEGLLYRKQGKNDQASAAFRRAAQRGVPDGHLLLGIVYKESGDYQGAEKEYREAERLSPQNGQVLLEFGKLLLTRGQLPEARIRLEKAVRYMPDAPGVHYQLGLLYRRLGDTDKSDRHFQLSRQSEGR